MDRPLMYRTQTSVTSSASPSTVYDTIADLRKPSGLVGRACEQRDVQAPVDRRAGGSRGRRDRVHVVRIGRQRHVPRQLGRHRGDEAPHVRARDRRPLDRKRGRPWDAHFSHRYDIASEGDGSRIMYTETIERVNYVPYWLQPVIRSLFTVYVNRADRKQLANLARLAEERASPAAS